MLILKFIALNKISSKLKVVAALGLAKAVKGLAKQRHRKMINLLQENKETKSQRTLNNFN